MSEVLILQKCFSMKFSRFLFDVVLFFIKNLFFLHKIREQDPLKFQYKKCFFLFNIILLFIVSCSREKEISVDDFANSFTVTTFCMVGSDIFDWMDRSEVLRVLSSVCFSKFGSNSSNTFANCSFFSAVVIGFFSSSNLR